MVGGEEVGIVPKSFRVKLEEKVWVKSSALTEGKPTVMMLKNLRWEKGKSKVREDIFGDVR